MSTNPQLFPEYVLHIGKHFQLAGAPLSAIPYGRGHIHDTFLLACPEKRYLAQRINTYVFPHPEHVMENIVRVTTHLSQKLRDQGVTEIHRRVLQLVPTREESWFFTDGEGTVWRIYHFIEDSVAYPTAGTPRQASQVGATFGEYLALLSDLPGPPFHETIPRFHHTRNRYRHFQEAVDQDPKNRAHEASPEIQFAQGREAIAGQLLDLASAGALPTRNTHNDTKMNNLLFDRHTDQPLCVTDLDTTMPGLAAYDFGEMVRTVTPSQAEDNQDKGNAHLRLDMFRGLVKGFLEATRDILTAGERQTLVLGGKTMILENGVRFLTDYLQGDRYFKISYPGQNLDRCRSQFQLLESLEDQEEMLLEVIAPSTG